MRVFFATAVAALLSCVPRASSPPQATGSDDTRLAVRLVEALAEACPVVAVDDTNAREACASRLASLSVLSEQMSEPFLWGAQTTATSYRLEDGRTTRFNPLVWRKMYLSLEMFSGEYRIEQVAGRTILRATTRFRNALDPGEYPYPFWHSAAKWESYQRARETLFVIESGKVTGALRSATQDLGRPAVARAFDGNWRSTAIDGSEGPSVVLYRRLFSRSNPHVATLDLAFRAFEAESRQYNCAGCHRPDNRAGQRQLEMFCYPNQALASRHTIVRVIRERQMPPPSAALPGQPSSGIADDAQRQRLLDLALAFEAAAEAALASESASAHGLTGAVPSK